MTRSLLFAALLLAACTKAAGPSDPVLGKTSIFVPGVGVQNTDCRTGICQHNENVDMIRWQDAIYLIHRTARSQILGPDSSMHIYRSTDEGATFTDLATILAPDGTGNSADIEDGGFLVKSGRDLRDPCFYIVGNTLYVKALTRLPVTSARDSNVNTIAVETHSTDGTHWTPLTPMGPPERSFWRIREHDGVYYNAAYHDGDSAVTLFSSTNGTTWTEGASIYAKAEDTPLETELTFLPSGRLLALVRTDGTSEQLFGDTDTMTQVCWSDAPPYASFHCDAPLRGVRLDGPLSFLKNGRLFVVARKHLGLSDTKRTALFELTGNLEGGPLAVKEWFELPSAGDTSYAGGVELKSGAWFFSWYSGDIALDEPWLTGMLDATNIWIGTVDFQ
jgi:hypothetical protein